MGKMPYTSGTVVLLLLFFITLSTADIKSYTLTSDTRPLIFFEKFGFTYTGHVEIAISDVSMATVALAKPNQSQLGFFLLKENSLLEVLTEIEQNPTTLCILDSPYIKLLFTFDNMPLSFNRTFPVTSFGEYSLFFANCAPDRSVSMSLHTKFFNIDPNGSRNYLSLGQTYLPSLFFLFSIVYFTFLFFWLYLCYSNQHFLHWIHHLMTLLLITKAFNVLCVAEVNHYVKFTGTPHGWDVMFYIFQSIRVVLLFVVIILVGTGWSFLEPFLRERGKKVLMIVIPLQVLANVADIVVGKSGPFNKGWVTWNQVLFLVDFISCCVVIFLFVWSMRSLKAMRNLDRLTHVRQFYVFVIGYLVFPRLLLYALITIVSYKYQWVSNLAEESFSLAFYIVMFYMFRPVEKDECFLIDEEEVAEIAIKY